MGNNNTKVRLAILSFLQFAIWGSYLISMGNFLGSVGLSDKIWLFYAAQGFVSIFMPALMGVVADKWIPAQRALGMCHGLAATFMLCAWAYTRSATVEFGPLFTFYILSVAFYMPTIALSNSVAFSILKSQGLDTVKDFPPIRVLGTVGFIASMWFVNSFWSHDGACGFTFADNAYRYQYTNMQWLVAALLGFVTALYSLFLQNVPVAKSSAGKQSIAQILGLNAFKLFSDKRMAIFFIFSMLLGVALQITNGYASPFITSFQGVPEYADSFAAQNATMLISISQISEAFMILLIPFFLGRFGIKKVMLMAMMAWVFRFGLFGIGSPGSGVWLFILSMIVYGVAFDFFNVSGALFVEQETDGSIKASAQGLFMLMTNGVGATIGMWGAGAIVNHFCHYENGFLIGNWEAAWLIFATYALVVAVLFAILFRYKHVRPGGKEIAVAESMEVQ